MLSNLFSWDMLWWIIMILYVPSCIGLIVIVLLQKGKGVGFAGAFGVGAGSDTVFGPRASKSLPQRMTYVMAATFMVLAFVMSLISGRLGKGVAPERLSDQAATSQVDLGVLDDLGSGIKGEPAVTPPAGQTSTTPAAGALETPPLEKEAPAIPAPAAPPPAPETPAPADK
jgi:preprotein translocase subunit SecG